MRLALEVIKANILITPGEKDLGHLSLLLSVRYPSAASWWAASFPLDVLVI